MDDKVVKLSVKEEDLLVRACTSYQGRLAVSSLTPAEKAACGRLAKNGMVACIMDTFYEVTPLGRVRATSIY